MSETGKMSRSNMAMVIKILEKHSDAEHPLSVNDVAALIKEDFRQTVSAKTVSRILRDDLVDNDAFPLLDYFDVQKDEDKLKYLLAERKIKTSESDYILYDAKIWHINREFDDSELQLLIDSLLYMSLIPLHQCEDIILKLKGLSSKYFKALHDLPFNAPKNNQRLLLARDTVKEAIVNKCKISFGMRTYGTDKSLHPALRADGSVQKYDSFSPYEIVIKNGHYYIIGAFDKGDLYHFRCDLIDDVEIMSGRTDEAGNIIEAAQKARPLSDIPGHGRKLDVAQYLRERPHMFSGPSIRVVFRAYNKANKSIIHHILDHLGDNVRFSDENEDSVTVTARVNEQAFFYWALQYGTSVEILEPLKLRNRMRESLKEMLGKYGADNENTAQ